jgi:nucleoside-diphosphate-sugar epimerase
MIEMKVFVTGGTGFIGQHVVRKLINRGYDVFGLTRSEKGAADLRDLGAQVVFGDILDRDSMRESMTGSDIVFHLAGWYKIGSRDWMLAEATNVAGTRNVLRLAYELGIPKIIYTSTVAVYGDTKGELVDEFFFQGGPFVNEYDRTKWLAHYKVAVPLIEQGAPIIILLPGVIYGPGDHSLIGQMMELFYRGRMLAIPGPDLTVTYAHVEDIAEGHILAAEKGRVGESYILAGPAVPLGEVVDFWGQLTGGRVPILRVPARLIVPFAPLLSAIGKLVALPPLFSEDGVRLLEMNYMARADKAQVELGWRTRSMQEGMSETFRWIAGTVPAKPTIRDRERKIAGLALLLAAAIFALWLIGRRRE